MRISIVVPVLNEAAGIKTCLDNLLKLEGDFEIIVSDGGSCDGTIDIVKKIVSENSIRINIKLIQNTRPGRAIQMNAGAEAAQGEIVLFMHADCELHPSALRSIEASLNDANIIGGGFYKKYSKESLLLWVYRIGMNLIRTKFLKNLVGTNAMFIRKNVFFQLGSFPDTALLEDVIFSDRMKAKGKQVFLRPHVTASSRRYRESGVLKRIWVAYKIMYLYRVKQKQPDELKQVYQHMNRSLSGKIL